MSAGRSASHDAPGLALTPAALQRLVVAWWGAIRQLGLTRWKRVAQIALAGFTLQVALTLDELSDTVPASALPPFIGAAAIVWAAQMSLAVCGWAIADKAASRPDQRPRRLVVALLAAVLLQALVVPPLTHLLVGPVDPCLLHGCEGIDWSKVPAWMVNAEDSAYMLIMGALWYAWLEFSHRDCEMEARLLTAQQERARLQRSALEARLTAMRAQVDPQFLFDSLADVQHAYAGSSARGGMMLDRLIDYLHAALPRLRSEGSTIGTEAELAGAWLAVVQSRRDGTPAWRVELDAACATAPFAATVLLPLVQWAVGDAHDRAHCVTLQVVRAPGDLGSLRAELRVAPGRRSDADETALRRAREQMLAAHGDAASLECWHAREPAELGRPAHTLIVLRWPDESAERDRR